MPRKMPLQGKISISRVHSSHDGVSHHGDYMNVTIVDESSGIQFVDVQVDIKTFMDVLTGLARQPCEFELRQPEFVGMVKEMKSELVPKPEWHATEKDLDGILASFEVDGWTATRENIKNHHNYRGDKVQVNFYRYVAPTPEE